MIAIFAPAGIGEVGPQTDLAAALTTAVAENPDGPLADGDILVVTSKILSKAEGRTAPAAERDEVITAETVRTVARRGPTRIVRTRAGLVLAAAGVDNSNVAPGTVLRLPEDADASAARLREALQRRTGVRLGVVVSDTAGRPWRVGQVDHAIGVAGVLPLEAYAGRLDPYGNRLEVTAMALADELAAAADLAKGKLAGRPLAVVRGLGHLVADVPDGARALVRPEQGDMFGYGSRESVLAAALAAAGRLDAYERLVALDGPDRVRETLAAVRAEGPAAALLAALLEVDLASASVLSEPR
ncbi:MAG TPA: coenzyme F420-0:L-glutamate ligase [Propionibacteriaceae bacterium]|nr:coenzyme F420-0:L-glutamate ligase [Propionibacteriaceae bacterium]